MYIGATGTAHKLVQLRGSEDVNKVIHHVYPHYDPKDGCNLLTEYDSNVLSTIKKGVDPIDMRVTPIPKAVIKDHPFKPKCGCCCCCCDDKHSDTGSEGVTATGKRKATKPKGK